LLGVNAGTETEEKREFIKDITKDYDRFEKKLDELDGTEYFDSVLEDYDLNTVPNMSIIRLKCKVVGKMQKNQVEIFNPLKNFIKLPRAVRRSMDSNSGEVEPIIIEGPVLKVEVIAVYK
jgi:hypothetical protein